MAPATLKVNLQNPLGPGSGCEWWWWSRGLHLKLIVSSKASGKEMQDQSYGPWPMYVYELLWCQTRHSSLIWLKCEPFCKFTYTGSLKAQHVQIPWRKPNITHYQSLPSDSTAVQLTLLGVLHTQLPWHLSMSITRPLTEKAKSHWATAGEGHAMNDSFT